MYLRNHMFLSTNQLFKVVQGGTNLCIKYSDMNGLGISDINLLLLQCSVSCLLAKPLSACVAATVKVIGVFCCVSHVT